MVLKEKFCKVECSFEEEVDSAEEQPASNKMDEAIEYRRSKDSTKVQSLLFILELLNC